MTREVVLPFERLPAQFARHNTYFILVQFQNMVFPILLRGKPNITVRAPIEQGTFVNDLFMLPPVVVRVEEFRAMLARP